MDKSLVVVEIEMEKLIGSMRGFKWYAKSEQQQFEISHEMAPEIDWASV